MPTQTRWRTEPHRAGIASAMDNDTARRVYGPGVRWGLSISLSGAGRPGLARGGGRHGRASRLGWRVRLGPPVEPDVGAPFADPFVTLAAIASATERVAIGTMVAALPRRRPQLVAQATTSLDRLSRGRMVLGLGLGVDSYGEYSLFGEPAADDRGSRRCARRRDRVAHADARRRAGTGCRWPDDDGSGCPEATGPDLDRRPDGLRAPGPRRVARHGLEGLALVGVDAWTPEHVIAALRPAGSTAGALDVVLVGGTHPDPPRSRRPARPGACRRSSPARRSARRWRWPNASDLNRASTSTRRCRPPQ